MKSPFLEGISGCHLRGSTLTGLDCYISLKQSKEEKKEKSRTLEKVQMIQGSTLTGLDYFEVKQTRNARKE